MGVRNQVHRMTRDYCSNEKLIEFDDCSSIRLLYVSERGFIFVSPEGTHLPDSQKGLWLSCDDGTTWTRVIDLGNAANPICVWGFSVMSNGTCFAGIYSLADEANEARIYRSSDDGVSWSLCYENPAARHIHDISCDTASGVVYASYGDNFRKWQTKGLVRTTDGGESWHEVLEELPQVAPILSIPGARFFGTDSPGVARIYKSTDDINAQLVLDLKDNLYFFWMRYDHRSGFIYASGVNGNKGFGFSRIFCSVDQGATWHEIYGQECVHEFDGSAHASNVYDSALVFHIQRQGKLSESIHADLKSAIPNSLSVTKSELFFERVVAFSLLLIVSPLLACSSALIILTTGESPLFMQIRRGIGGKPFAIIKLRTMTTRQTASHLKETAVTSIGEILRSLSIDELPQLLNVVLGHMRLVGPRPHPLALDSRWSAEIAQLYYRYSVFPGITGLAQVSGCRGSIEDQDDMLRRLELDFRYIENRTFELDLIIVLKTIFFGFLERTRFEKKIGSVSEAE